MDKLLFLEMLMSYFLMLDMYTVAKTACGFRAAADPAGATAAAGAGGGGLCNRALGSRRVTQGRAELGIRFPDNKECL